MKGQISILTAVIGATGMITASAFTSWATVSSRISKIETTVATVEEREGNHYEEIQKQLGRIDGKLDTLIKYNGTR